MAAQASKPKGAVRPSLAGFPLGSVHDRRLVRDAQVNLAIPGFIGCELHEALPDHSFLTRIRQRRGDAMFRRVHVRIVQQCRAAVSGGRTGFGRDRPNRCRPDPGRCQHGCVGLAPPGRGRGGPRRRA
ncbi:hypothetical protein DKT77_17705 [Meridianimarinicoccus roseus]|uniref:Transposase InsH N-terminal domain-containing protein n=1 Tax=Meridianimarinicoccus roseus TaxID=2072018 RepID=A0A2V2LBT9_9RHOB|nr:hypothetical protein DKT77_20480 [Meridianimarinicoccus roseus]PWR01274.1 hypothetical protein DKT77_17705 [Meridianimarinicoccus roseus]